MPITTSAKKANRQAERRRLRNLKKKNEIKKTIKEFERALKAKKTADASAQFSRVQKVLDKAVKTGILKKNTASRRKSRLSKLLK